MPTQLISEMERKMKASLQDLDKDLATLRTGRATPALLDKITVDYYGTQTPLSQVGTVSSPDPRQLLIQPWDKSLAGAIANAITKSDLGFQATKDGDSVRVSIPALNEERRREMVKLAGKKAEEHKVAIRNVRREANDRLKKMEKDGEMTKDDLQRLEGEVQKSTDRIVAEIDRMRAAKEADILEVYTAARPRFEYSMTDVAGNKAALAAQSLLGLTLGAARAAWAQTVWRHVPLQITETAPPQRPLPARAPHAKAKRREAPEKPRLQKCWGDWRVLRCRPIEIGGQSGIQLIVAREELRSANATDGNSADIGL